MSIIDEYIKSGGGNWIRAADVRPGDTVIMEDIYLDKETFDKAYICIKGKSGQTDEPVSVRLGIQNVSRIAEILGKDEKGWIGHKLKVLGTQDYPGLGAKGILWTGEKIVSEVLTEALKPSTKRVKGPFDTHAR